jgi:ribosomal-protein-alanine N-acetyltransferase
MPETLHPPTPADAAPLIAAHRASRAFHTPYVHPFTDQSGFDTWFASLSSSTNESFVIRDSATKDIAGVINLSQIIHGNFRSAYLGVYAMSSHAGRGLMTEALRLTITHAFETLALHRLEANIQPTNEKSRALIRRCNFRQEGYSPAYLHIAGAWRDHERWALLNPAP